MPVDAVRAGSTVLVVDSATAVGPERVVKPVVGASAARSAAAGNELANLGGVEGHGEDAGGAEDEGLERNHDSDVVCSERLLLLVRERHEMYENPREDSHIYIHVHRHATHRTSPARLLPGYTTERFPASHEDVQPLLP